MADLSDRKIRALPRGVHNDGSNLYLRVHNSSRTWVYRDRRGGQDDWMTLGHYPDLSLSDARSKALLLKRGGGSSRMTVQQAWELYYAHLERQYEDPGQVKARMERDVLPKIGSRAIRAVTRTQVSETLQLIVDRGSLVQANRTLADVKNLFRYATEKGWIEASPIEILTRNAVGGQEETRSRTLSWDEIKDFFKMLVSSHMEPGTAWALYFCLLTGARASEALQVLRTRSLTVDSKPGRQHSFPATPHINAVLRLAKGCAVPQSHRVLSRALLRRKQTFTPHDLRRTFSSRLADMGVAPHIVEKLLNHQLEGVMAVYNRATYWPERVAAQRLWGYKVAFLRRTAWKRSGP